jgi:hypothetical protein
LELNVELRWQAAEPRDDGAELAEIDEQVIRWRGVLSEMAQREAATRARLAQIQSSRAGSSPAVSDQRAWLAVGRQLAADLAGEVSRLARAAGSEQCVCRDAHPRLRPIAETLERQLDSLETLIDEQRLTLSAAELSMEATHLAGSQAELRRHVERLLDRRQALTHVAVVPRDESGDSQSAFSAADAQQLQSRRSELEQQRFQLLEQLQTHSRILRDVRAQRETVDRQRAALLSARSIEHVQRELADVQQKLESAANGTEQEKVFIGDDVPSDASDFLAHLTNGDLVQVTFAESGRGASVTNRAGETVRVESLEPAQLDQVYLSLCLASLRAASRQGIWLPLVLDEPFERLDARGAAALAAVLDAFCRQGHQVLVFTGQRAAAERLASYGGTAHDILSRRNANTTTNAQATGSEPTRRATVRKRRPKRLKSNGSTVAANDSVEAMEDKRADANRSDAA